MTTPLVKPLRTSGPELGSYSTTDFVVIDNVIFDCAVEETHEASATVTTHPMSANGNATDHIRPEPRRYNAELRITNTPIDLTPVSLLIDPDRVQAAHQAILRTIRAGLLVQLISGFDTYSSMAIESYSSTRNAQTGQILACTLSLVEVVIVDAQTTQIPPAPTRPDKKAGAAAASDAGTQPGTPTTPEAALAGEAQAADKSVAAGLFDSGASFGGF